MIPAELSTQLKSCRWKISMASCRNISKEEAEDLRRQLSILQEQLGAHYNFDPPAEVLEAIFQYSEKINQYIEKKVLLENASQPTMAESPRNDDLIDRINVLTQQVQMLSPSQINEPPTPQTSGTIRSSVKIRKENLPHFAGKYTNWKVYASLMVPLVIENPMEENVAKSYLLNSLSNEPKRFVETILATHSLSETWEKLKHKYEDSLEVSTELREELKSIPYVRNEDDRINLKKARDVVSAVAQAFASEANAESLSLTMMQAVANRFYFKAQRHMHTRIRSFDELAEYVNMLYEDASRFERAAVRVDKPSITNPNLRNRMAAILPFSPQSCDFCNGQHLTRNCTSQINLNEKSKIIKEKKLCIRCLLRGHKYRECRVRVVNCETCSGRHCTLVHDVMDLLFLPSARNIQPQTSTFDPANVTSVKYYKISASRITENLIFEVTDMKNIGSRPKIEGICSKQKCEMLIDYGSEVSLIDAKLVPDNIPLELCNIQTKSPLNSETNKTKGRSNLVIRKGGAPDVTIKVFVTDLEDEGIILGTDMVAHIFPGCPEKLKINSIFGPIEFFARSARFNNKIAACSSTNWWNMDNAEETDCANFDIKLTRLSDGRFETNLPFLSNDKPTSNFNSAMAILNQQLLRLKKSGLFSTYRSQLFEYLTNDHAELTTGADGYFLPHHPVIRHESQSTPLRIVFNASHGAQSLNSCLWKGEVKNLDALQHLIRFRTGKFAVIADLSKAFLQIRINPEHRKFLKFLWKDDDGDLKIYQMKSLPFGVICAPAILIKAINLLFEQNNWKQIASCIYMDDLILTDDENENLTHTLKKTDTYLQSAGFSMHKIKSNLESNAEASEPKVLGMHWLSKQDTIACCLPELTEVIDTRRKLLSLIGKIFDPLGMLDPWKLFLRMIYRECLAIDWDTLLPIDILKRLHKHLLGFEELRKVCLPRMATLKRNFHLVGFADASKQAFGYVIFSFNRLENHWDFLFGKSKIATVDKTIVESELMALSELASATEKIIHYLGSPATIDLFSDSKINLERLKLSPNSFNIKIARILLRTTRIIHRLNANVRHIPGKTNPADYFTHPIIAADLMASFPYRVALENLDFSTNNNFRVFKTANLTKRVVNHPIEKAEIIEFLKLDTTEKMFQFIKCRMSPEADSNLIWKVVYQIVQQSASLNELTIPYFIHDDIIKINTRRSDFAPIWIPKDSALASAIIQEHHELRMHSGVRDTVASIQEEFYIRNLNRLVKGYIHRCRHCQIERKRAIQQPFANLPACRTSLLPFEAISVDCFGPFFYSNGKKYFGLLATCLSSRMVKLEVLNSLSADSTLVTLNAIFCSMGTPSLMFTDNGTNFVRSNKEIKKLYEDLKVKSVESSSKIVWNFSPPSAPWYNGCAERMVQVAKRCLRSYDHAFKGFYDARLGFLQAEFIMNGRPIIKDDERWISPFEIVFGRRPTKLPEISTAVLIHPKKLRNQLRETRLRFERLWRSQYVLSLSSPRKSSITNVAPGQHVLIPSELKKRHDWPVGEVVEVWPSDDGVVRRVKIKWDNKVLVRPANGLVVLESAGECGAAPSEQAELRGQIL